MLDLLLLLTIHRHFNVSTLEIHFEISMYAKLTNLKSESENMEDIFIFLNFSVVLCPLYLICRILNTSLAADNRH